MLKKQSLGFSTFGQKKWFFMKNAADACFASSGSGKKSFLCERRERV